MESQKTDDATKAENSSGTPSWVFVTAVTVEEKETEKKEESFIKKNASKIGAGLVFAFLAILWLSAALYDDGVQSQISGSYTITTERIDVPDPLLSHIDEFKNLYAGVMSDSNGDIAAMLSLPPRRGNFSDKTDEYRITSVILSGKKTKTLQVNEKVIPGTTVIAMFSDPQLELGHTLRLEITVGKSNSTEHSSSSYSYNIDFLRESNGKIYYIEGIEDVKREPGFEVVMAISAMMIIAIAIRRRKKE